MRKALPQLLLSLLLVGLSVGNALAEKIKVEMKTSLGTLTLSLDRDRAPQTVDNFLQYARDGFYDNTIFHRVIEDFMIQGGGFSPDMVKKPTRPPIKNEADNGLKNKRGTIAMARTSAPHSATAQFFINHKDNDQLDYPSFDGWGYAVFGEVTAGMSVVDAIASAKTGNSTVDKYHVMQNVPLQPILIESVHVIE